MAANRIDPQTAHDHLESGQALLVCAYDSNEKFEKYHLEGAMSLDEFESRKDSISKDQEIITYCD